MKILGIDDNIEINKLLNTIVTSDGHEFSQVTEGKKGLELIRQGGFDAVLLDIAMPDFSGMDVINALIEDNKIKDTPIVLFSASSISEDDIQEMIAKGVYDFIKKPASISEILMVLKKIEKENNA